MSREYFASCCAGSESDRPAVRDDRLSAPVHRIPYVAGGVCSDSTNKHQAFAVCQTDTWSLSGRRAGREPKPRPASNRLAMDGPLGC